MGKKMNTDVQFIRRVTCSKCGETALEVGKSLLGRTMYRCSRGHVSVR
ncbi:hypothetical protein Krac_8599 [Ktedonobacter racemifer DSM 44963]|uniref:Insertion element protein n=1 Tax=Ktedonobacter racemifer DSM 44963 TaxID=485913 RepID=D6TND8_KTERA|nr:hypothetical protein Krac_8599 [Ktedonobacter racemifer DSM 44963]